MDLNNLSLSDTYSFFLIHPTTSEPLDIKITVYGFESDIFKSIILDIREKNGVREDLSNEDVNKASLDILARCTKSWTNLIIEGVRKRCTTKNALHIYSQEGWGWIVNQVREAVYTRENYYKV